jgi:hypothetical protein
MKVIKPEVDLETWSMPYKCPHCNSEIAIENEDVYYEYDRDGRVWKITCCLCNCPFRLSDGDLPKIVRASAEKHRCIVHYCND